MRQNELGRVFRAIAVSDDKDLLSLVTDGNNCCTSLASMDIELANNVIAYHSMLSALASGLNVNVLVETLQPIAQGYADHARAESEFNQKFFAEFSDYISTVDKHIVELGVSLKTIDDEIIRQSAALEGKDIIFILWNAFKKLFKLSKTPVGSDVQIMAILGVALSTLTGTFMSLWEDTSQLKKVISSLRGLRTRITDLQTRFSALSKSLKTVLTSSSNLLTVWDDVAAHMGTVSANTQSIPPEDAKLLIKAWETVATDAHSYIEALQKPSSAGSNYIYAEMNSAPSTRFTPVPKVPVTSAEIGMHRLAEVFSGDALFSSFAANCMEESVSNSEQVESISEHDEAVINDVLAPSAETLQRLDNLADDTGRIMQQFKTMLSQPYLDQYQCTSPIDGSESNLHRVMMYYNNKYFELQNDTIPVANNLRAYAQLQMTLLPNVVPDSQASADNIGMTSFIETNLPLVKQFQDHAANLSSRSTQVKNEWGNVINLIQKKIAESQSSIDTISKSINDLTDDQKKQSTHSWLKALGIFVAFTAVAFAPVVGLLCALAIGSWLGDLSVQEANEAHKITVTISTLNGALTNAQTTRDHLQELLPFCEAISNSLSSISLIWAEIRSSLQPVATFFDAIKGPTGESVLKLARNSIIKKWEEIDNGVEKYLEAVSK